MSRPGPWTVVWREFWNSLSRHKTLGKNYVGEDPFGNKYYEYSRTRRANSVKRGYDPAPGAPPPPVEWLSWTKMARRFPPSDEEIRLNMQRQQAQIEQDSQTEKRAPTIDSHGIGAADMDKKQEKGFPRYQEKGFEMNPGAKNLEDLEKEKWSGQ